MKTIKLVPKIYIDNILYINWIISDSNQYILESELYNKILLKDTHNKKIEYECDDCKNKTQLKKIRCLTRFNVLFLCKKCRFKGERNGMFNKKHSKETKKLFSKTRKGVLNPFYNKKHTNKTKKRIGNKNKEQLKKRKNPMAIHNVYEWMVLKYGKEKADKKWKNKYKKHSKKMKLENPMHIKNVFEYWVEKYGFKTAKQKQKEKIQKFKDKYEQIFTEDYKNNMSQILKGRKFSETHRKNLRIASLKLLQYQLSLTGKKIFPNFNVFACKLFDEINKLKSTNIQHALNEGELYIPELGYWVDGYDKENNIVYEYYEKEHKRKIKKDLIRQKEIQNFLNCDFIIIEEGKEENYLKQEIINKIKKC